MNALRRCLVACLSSAAAVLGLIWAPGPRAQATPPVTPLAAGLVAADGQYGTIKGRLVWGGDKAPEPKVLEEKGKASKDPTVCAASESIMDRKLVVDPKTKGVKFGLVYLVRPNGANPDAVKALIEKRPKVEIDQKNCEYIPYVIGMNQGQALVLKSSDPVNHNIHLNAFQNEAFNVILPPNGQMTKNLVAEKRVLPLTCDIHPWMKAWIMVYDHPFFAVTAEDGSFEIHGVPAGMQNLVAWQEAVGFVTPNLARGMQVQVEAGGTKDVGEIKLDPSKVK